MDKIVLTADQSLFTTYRGNTFVGYLGALPVTLAPKAAFNYFFPMPPRGAGVPVRPHLSLRTIEAILARDPALKPLLRVVHPDDLEVELVGARVVCLSTMDPRGLGPATSSWQMFRRGRPFHVAKFWELLERVARLKGKFGFKLLVGGTGTWQLAHEDILDATGIDYLFVGEAERDLVPYLKSIIAGEDVPRIKHGSVTADLAEVPPLLGPTVLAMQEVTRGCGRMCQFCAPTTSGKMRHLPLETILTNCRTFLEHGERVVNLQSEDTLRYGSKDFRIDEDKLLELYESIFALGVKRVFITHATFANFVAQPDTIDKLGQFLHAHGHKYYGFQPGLETGSTRLIKTIMGGKMQPVRDMDWPELVLEAFKTIDRNRWVPTASIILGFPGEDEDDLGDTEYLVNELIRHDYFFVFAPLLFVPVPETPLGKFSPPSTKQLSPRQRALFKKMWKFNLRGKLLKAWNVYNIRGYQFPRWKEELLRRATNFLSRFY
ncbi:MAG: B12-binding domain-containing radical SAM protein [Promethearchaeota archaeon]